jgi:hypothetical protein
VRFIFCDDPLTGRGPDPSYEAETAAVRALGGAYALVSYEALVNDADAAAAVRRVGVAERPELGVYRGWMLRPDQYAALYAALAGRGVQLVNDPAAYRHCHHLPESYGVIEGKTPRSVWLRRQDGLGLDRVMEAVCSFGAAPIIVKDFVKSQKHAWREACFIPDASDRAGVERVVSRFLELQGGDLAEGPVFREYVPFEQAGTHPRSGMPLAKEFRLFFLDGTPLAAYPYWAEGEYGDLSPPVDEMQEIAARVRSRFFTMDVARRADGDWMIVELGDGQVAGLPDGVDERDFYQRLLDRAPQRPYD